MYSDWVLMLLFGAQLVWFLVLSYLIFRQKSFLNSLFPKSGERDIRKRFEELIQVVSKFKLDLGEFKEVLSETQRDGLTHVQRVELLRFNPYHDTGGDQSFTIALLNKKGNGVVITSLHSRSGTRVFAKEVILGKRGKYEFSKEEEQAVKKAMV